MYSLEITPRTGRTFFIQVEGRDAALAAFDAECGAPNRVYVALYQERDLWEEQQAAATATLPEGTRVRIDNPSSLLHGKTGRVHVADHGDGTTVVMLLGGVRFTVPTADLVTRDGQREAA